MGLLFTGVNNSPHNLLPSFTMFVARDSPWGIPQTGIHHTIPRKVIMVLIHELYYIHAIAVCLTHCES